MGNKKKRNNSKSNTPIKIQLSDIIALVSLIIAIVALIVSSTLGNKANELSERNQAIDLQGIELDDNNDAYLAKLDLSQGKVKKAYLATIIDKEIIYKELRADSLHDIEIDKKSIDIHEVESLNKEKGEADFQSFAEKINVEINDISDFGLIFLDYSNHWSFYYVLLDQKLFFLD